MNYATYNPIQKTSLSIILVFLFIGITVAGGLTYFMHVLIASSQQELDNAPRANLLDFVRVKRSETSTPKRQKPQRPELNDAPPSPPTPQAQQNDFTNAQLNVAAPEVTTDLNVEVGGLSVNVSDGEYLPIVKIAPTYPIEALSKGLEGHCTVKYTVTKQGTTKNVEAIDGECPRVFARASIAAAKKFKYKPKMEDGKAVEVPLVYNKFKFELESND